MTDLATDWPQQGARRGWLGSDLDRRDFTFELGRAELEKLRAAGEGSDGSPDSGLSASFEPVVHAIKHGPGIAVVRGLDPSKDSIGSLATAFRAAGRCVGRPLSQNAAGELLTRVESTDSAAHGVLRAYLSNGPLSPHTDPTEILALLCIRKAAVGGANRLISSLKVHEVIARDFARHLPVLMRGFRYSRLDEQPPGVAPVTPYHVPVFGAANGLMSCCWVGKVGAELAAQQVGSELTPLEKEALEIFETVASRREHQLEIQLEPGDMMLINNYEVLHSREAFVDSPEPGARRLLLRLWLECDPRRPLPRQMYIHENASGRNGVDPVASSPAERGRMMVRRIAPRRR